MEANEQLINDQIPGADAYDLYTLSMLSSLLTEYADEKLDRTKWDVLDAIKSVVAGKPHELGDVFTARVWESISFTPDPFAPH